MALLRHASIPCHPFSKSVHWYRNCS
jgi:hypothetical protein